MVNGDFTFVIDAGNITIGSRNGRKMPHPTLLGGDKDEDIQPNSAGRVVIAGGKIKSIRIKSGHFKPGRDSAEEGEAAYQTACEVFSRLPRELFVPGFLDPARKDRGFFRFEEIGDMG